MEVEKDEKLAADRSIDMQKQVAKSEKGTDDALRQSGNIPKRVGLQERKALVLKAQLSKIETARNAAVFGFEGWSREIRALEARVRTLCNEADLLKRLE